MKQDPIKEGDIYLSKFPACVVVHQVVKVKEKKIRLRALMSGYEFDLSREVILKHWLPKKKRGDTE